MPDRCRTLPPAANPLRLLARIPPTQIGFVNAIVESYEGACVMRTRDAARGEVEFWVMRDFRPAFDRMIDGFRQEMMIEFSAADPEDWDSFEERGFVKR